MNAAMFVLRTVLVLSGFLFICLLIGVAVAALERMGEP